MKGGSVADDIDMKVGLNWYKSKEINEWLKEFLERIRSNPIEALPRPAMEQPPLDVVLPLMRHQKEWLSWALNQEASRIRGGILADEMGMGKTIEAIALVLAARFRRRQSGDVGSCSSSSVLPRTTGCTLVICPRTAMYHWEDEIKKCTKKGSTRVLVYYGLKRARIKHNFDDYDFVLTTYKLIQSEFRDDAIPRKEKCPRRGKMFDAWKLQEHQLRDHCSPAKKQDLADYEDAKGKGVEQGVGDSPKEGSILHSVIWERIILDEAHNIKDKDCKTAKAVFALQSRYKWALSATPLQNQVGELFSLVRFLGIYPFSYYWCLKCDCRTLEIRAREDCSDCHHGSSRHKLWWYQNITHPIEHLASLWRPRVMIMLKERILKNIMLRRTKEDLVANLDIPPKIVYPRRDSMDKIESDIYRALYNKSHIEFDKYAIAGTVMVDNTNSSTHILRCRQVVDHPYLIQDSKSGPANRVTEGCKSWVSSRIGNEAIQKSTKIDALKEEIRNMLEDDASAKGVVFSEFKSFLDLIKHFLEDSGLKCATLDGSMSAIEKKTAINSFTKDGDCKIFLMTLKARAEVLDLTVASHVFMMEPWWDPADERWAQDRVHRIGQYKPVRIVRFIIKGTIEENILVLQVRRDLVFQGMIGYSTDWILKNLDEKYFKPLFRF